MESECVEENESARVFVGEKEPSRVQSDLLRWIESLVPLLLLLETSIKRVKIQFLCDAAPILGRDRYLAVEEGKRVDRVFIKVLVPEFRWIFGIDAELATAVAGIVRGEVADFLIQLEVVTPQGIDFLLYVGQLVPQFPRFCFQLHNARLEPVSACKQARSRRFTDL